MIALGLGLGLMACSPPPEKKLPGMSFSEARTATAPTVRSGDAPACGLDVSYEGHAVPDIEYAYRYDALGRLAHASGTFAHGGAKDVIDYAYDHLGHMTHMVETRAGGGAARLEITQSYDTLGDLVAYDYAAVGLQVDDTYRYTYDSFTESGQPAHQVANYPNVPAFGFVLDYDDADRLVHVTGDDGENTTYTYDDTEARRITIDTNAGAFHGEVVYDDGDRELYETWGGTDANARKSETQYSYDGDRLTSVTYHQTAPEEGSETDTLLYRCDSR